MNYGGSMKQILLSLFLILSLSAYSAHHEEGKVKNQFQLLSTYEIAAGQNPQDLAEELMEMQKNQESYGYNNCGVYQHQFGAMRGFYTYCNFDDMKQFAAVMKKSIAAQSTDPSPVQSYASHSDNIVAVLERNLTEAPNYILNSEYNFGPYLTANEQLDRANKLYDVYKEGFGACNLTQHRYGPEYSFYIVCGFDDFDDFAKKSAKSDSIYEKSLMDEKLDIKVHSDNMLIKVMD